VQYITVNVDQTICSLSGASISGLSVDVLCNPTCDVPLATLGFASGGGTPVPVDLPSMQVDFNFCPQVLTASIDPQSYISGPYDAATWIAPLSTTPAFPSTDPVVTTALPLSALYHNRLVICPLSTATYHAFSNVDLNSLIFAYKATSGGIYTLLPNGGATGDVFKEATLGPLIAGTTFSPALTGSLPNLHSSQTTFTTVSSAAGCAVFEIQIYLDESIILPAAYYEITATAAVTFAATGKRELRQFKIERDVQDLFSRNRAFTTVSVPNQTPLIVGLSVMGGVIALASICAILIIALRRSRRARKEETAVARSDLKTEAPIAAQFDETAIDTGLINL